MHLLSSRLAAVQPSPTLSITAEAAALRRQGHDVISLSQGEPDFDTPLHIAQAAKAAIDQGATRYTDVDGTMELKRAIVQKLKRENGLDYDTSQISVGTGGKQVIFNALFASLDAGDEVLVPTPYWVSYPDIVRLAGGVPVSVATSERAGFKLDAHGLAAAITPRTKWLVLNSPSNPTGSAYTADELRQLASVLRDYPRVHVLSDEIYEHVRYVDGAFASIADVEPRLLGRTLTCNGVSKAFAMTGWRIGYAAGPQALIQAMATIQSQSTSNPSSVSQAAALAALTGPMDFLTERNAVFRERRDLAAGILNATPGLRCAVPDGAFYLYPSCEGLMGRRTPDGRVLHTDGDLASYLLHAARVAVVPGAAFGHSPYFRISFATATERLRTACERIARACAELRA